MPHPRPPSIARPRTLRANSLLACALTLLVPACSLSLCFLASSGQLLAAENENAQREATRADLDQAWKKLSRPDYDYSAREVAQVLLGAVDSSWHPDRWPLLLSQLEELHNRNQKSDTFGNYRWYRHQAEPDDRNAVEFCLQLLCMLRKSHANRLTPALQAQLDQAMTLAVEGVLRHKVRSDYTNIFLMKSSNVILAGELLGREDLVRQGCAWLEEWDQETAKHGLHEYSSPTYYGVDLEDLNLLLRYSSHPEIRDWARARLRLFWTELAANFFAPHGGITGAHSRDYDFLRGHGLLDQQLLQAGWLQDVERTESHPVQDRLSYAPPPADLPAVVSEMPRTVVQKWGAEDWERATHYVGRHFSLGSAGASYGAQDKVLSLALTGGPKRPLINFLIDYHNDPYGQSKVKTSGDHPKLTHLEPFVASVQQGSDVLFFASIDPAKTPNPAGKNFPPDYKGVVANLILPANLEISTGSATIPSGESSVALPSAQFIYLRDGDVVVALCVLHAFGDAHAEEPSLRLERDGTAQDCERLCVSLAKARPERCVGLGLWLRVREGLDEEGFKRFRQDCEKALAGAKMSGDAQNLKLTVPAKTGRLELVLDVEKQRRLKLTGGDALPAGEILSVNGQGLGRALLAPIHF